MRIDAYNHFFPKKYYEKMGEVGSGLKDMFNRTRSIPCIHDLDERFRVMDLFQDYAQVLSLPAPRLEVIAKGDPKIAEELAKIGNDGLAELVAKYPDRFPGFVAQTPLIAKDAGVAETERAIKQLGALGTQIYTNVAGKPLDRPEFEPFFAAMNKIGKPIWIHPDRSATHPDYMDEQKSLYEIWWTFGWPYETSVAMARLVFSKTLDKYPNLKIIIHHLGAMVPIFEAALFAGTSSGPHVGRGLCGAARRNAARLLQAGLLRRHRGVRLARRDRLRARILRRRPGGVRLGQPVRSGEGPRLYPRDHQDPGLARPDERGARQDLLQEPGGTGR
jgi:aminocarboxymuconate-semialdehyde decarboxylase